MRVFLVGSDKIYAIENFYVKYMKELGIEVFHFTAQSIFYDYYQKNIINKLIFKSGCSGILNRINRQFKKDVDNFGPQVIWVFKGMEIFPESLQWARDKHIKMVNYNPDNPFIFSGKGSGNTYLKKSIALYDLHLTYNSQVKRDMEDDYKIKTEILPFGFDITDTLYKKCVSQTEVMKTCFLGNPDKYRGKFLQQLAEEGIEIDVYGNNWQAFVSHKNIQIFAPVYGDNFWLTLRRYRIQLNLMRPHNLDTHNMRSFEVPGCGGIQLAPNTPDHVTYFEQSKEIFVYDQVDGCISQIQKILSLSREEITEIRMQARKRSLECKYRYKDRAEQALGYISK